MNYMDLTVHCPRKAVKLNDSLTHLIGNQMRPEYTNNPFY